MLQISAWLLTILQVTACMLARNGSPFSATNSMYVAFATTVEEFASTLANYSVEMDSSSRTSWFCVRGGTPVRSRRCERIWVLLLLLMPLGFTSLVPLKGEVCWTASGGGNASIMTIVPFPFKGKDTPSPSSEFPIQTYPSISRAMGALDVVFEVTIRKMYLRFLDLFDLTTRF